MLGFFFFLEGRWEVYNLLAAGTNAMRARARDIARAPGAYGSPAVATYTFPV